MVLEPGIAYEILAPNGYKIRRVAIRRSGYWVARWRGHYFQLFLRPELLAFDGSLIMGDTPSGRC